MSDARGFRYALAALLQLQHWKRDAALRALGEAQRRLIGADEALVRLQQRQLAAASPGAAAGDPVDPVRSRARLLYLCRLAADIAGARADRDAAAEHANSLRNACADAQRRLDGIERHRQRSVAAHALVRSRVEAGRADQEWIARWTRLRSLEPGHEK
jgi:hypothetical protein